MPTWLKLDKSMKKLASEWVDDRPFARREIENNANGKFRRDNKDYYGIFEKGLLLCELPQASPRINLKVPQETYKLSKLLGRYKRRKLRKSSVKELLAQEPF